MPPIDRNDSISGANIQKSLLPILLGLALGGGGTFGVTSVTSEKKISQADIEKIAELVEKTVAKSQSHMETLVELRVKLAISEHEALHHRKE
jgi:hypothetical protein